MTKIPYEYLQSKVQTATPLETVTMIYEVAIHSLESAITHLKSGDAMARSKAVTKAQEAVAELSLAVDHSSGASFTKTLVELYAYVNSEIIKGHIEQSEAAFQNAISIMKTLLEAWSKLALPQIDAADAPEPSKSGYGAGSDYEPRDWTV